MNAVFRDLIISRWERPNISKRYIISQLGLMEESEGFVLQATCIEHLGFVTP